MGEKLLEKIFSVKNAKDNRHKVVNILCIKIKFKRKNPTIFNLKRLDKQLKERNMKVVKLHIGCGTIYKDGWLNIDNNSYGNIQKLDLHLDLREALPFKDNFADYIYNEHFLEHLTVEEGQAAIKEFMRVLKPGGVLRIAMPDLKDAIDAYLNENWKKDEGYQKFLKWAGLDFARTRAELLNINFRWWGHKWYYDKEELERRLRDAGCTNITFCTLNQSMHEPLKSQETRNESTLIAEVIK